MENNAEKLARAKRAAVRKMFPPKPATNGPPADSESALWRSKGERPQEDAEWLRDGGHSGKR
jgi:hypothetical protein